MMPTATELAYLAGIVDGEGCCIVSVSPHTDGTMAWTSCVRVVNTNALLMEWLQAHFGGKVYKHQHPFHNWKDAYVWVINSANLKDLLPQILPYSVIKHKQISLLIEFTTLLLPNGPPTMKGRILSDRNLCRRYEIRDEMRLLNKKGKR